MKRIIQYAGKSVVCACLTILCMQTVHAQYSLPAILDSATLESQLDYIQERTRIYNDYRAIREDMFLKIKGNAVDSLNEAKLDIATLQSKLTERDFEIETLNTELGRTKNDRDEAIRNKDSLSFLGIQMNKGFYNMVMWIIVASLAGAAVILFLLFKRTHAVTSQTRRELTATQDEFEAYKKSSREKYEKLVISHHNEIMKLKNS